MPLTIQIKRRDNQSILGPGAPGAGSPLKQGELAYNEVDEKLYYGWGYNSSTGNASTVKAIAGFSYTDDIDTGVFALVESSNDFTDSVTPTTNQFDAITTTGTITAGGKITVSTSDIEVSQGNITAGGGLTAASNKFSVNSTTGTTTTQGDVVSVNVDASGNIEADGTLKAANSAGTFLFSVSGAGAVSGASFTATGNIVATTGNIQATAGSLAGQSLNIAANTLAVATDGSITVTNGGQNFYVQGTTGNTDIAGTLVVDGTSSLGTNSGLGLPLIVADNTAAEVDINGTTNITGDLNVSADIYMNSQLVATQSYVDAVKQGLDVKDSVRVATTTAELNLGLSGSSVSTIDGISLSDGDRILVKNQNADPSENGIYTYNSSGAWPRATDANTSADVTPGLFAFVEEGNTNADTGWVLTTNAPITLDTTNLAFTQFSGAGQVGDGAGLSKNGNTLNVNVDEDAANQTGTTAIVNDTVVVSQYYPGNTNIVTVGTITTGTWNADTIAINKGGTGATSASAARSNLAVPGDDDDNIFTGANTFRKTTGTLFEQSATTSKINIQSSSDTNGNTATLTTTTLTGNRTATLPDATGTVILDNTLCDVLDAQGCTIDGGTF